MFCPSGAPEPAGIAGRHRLRVVSVHEGPLLAFVDEQLTGVVVLVGGWCWCWCGVCVFVFGLGGTGFAATHTRTTKLSTNQRNPARSMTMQPFGNPQPVFMRGTGAALPPRFGALLGLGVTRTVVLPRRGWRTFSSTAASSTLSSVLRRSLLPRVQVPPVLSVHTVMQLQLLGTELHASPDANPAAVQGCRVRWRCRGQ